MNSCYNAQPIWISYKASYLPPLGFDNDVFNEFSELIKEDMYDL